MKVSAGVELIATSRSGEGIGGQGPLALDLADAAACRAAVLEHRPDWVLNGGAYTAVNGGAPRAFAEALVETGRDLSGKLSARGAELSTEMDCTAS